MHVVKCLKCRQVPTPGFVIGVIKPTKPVEKVRITVCMRIPALFWPFGAADTIAVCNAEKIREILADLSTKPASTVLAHSRRSAEHGIDGKVSEKKGFIPANRPDWLPGC